MDSAGLLMSELDWLSTSLDRDLTAETLATLVPLPAAPEQEWEEPLAGPCSTERTSLLARVTSFLRGYPRID
jgi:hypothetical protein